jgi:hypothetical protein
MQISARRARRLTLGTMARRFFGHLRATAITIASPRDFGQEALTCEHVS